jgi:hypothetical protein
MAEEVGQEAQLRTVHAWHVLEDGSTLKPVLQMVQREVVDWHLSHVGLAH